MFKNKTACAALDAYYIQHNVADFQYEGMSGKAAFELYCIHNDEFLLELLCAYLDLVNNIKAIYPAVPQSV